MSTFKSSLGTALALILFLVPGMGPVAQAQPVDLGADVVSRYVWRGTDFGESLSIQPSLSYSANGFTVGSWGSFATSPGAAGVDEHDLYASYSVETAGGTVEVGVTDYYFPSAGAGFFNFDGRGRGAHQIESSLSYTGPDRFPLSLYGGVFVHNEPDHSVYLQASYPFSVESVDLAMTVGGTPSASAFYGTQTAGVINTGLSASKELSITDTFSLPVSVRYVLNPYTEKTFFVFGVHL